MIPVFFINPPDLNETSRRVISNALTLQGKTTMRNNRGSPNSTLGQSMLTKGEWEGLSSGIAVFILQDTPHLPVFANYECDKPS